MGDERILDFDVAVVGAGLSGLVAATVASRAGASVVLFDVRSPGGRARSDERDGYVLNQGPHAIYRSGPGASILGRLGVSLQGAPPHRGIAGYRASTGELGLLPTSAGTLLRSPLLGTNDKLRLGRLLTSLPRLDAASLAAKSAAAWIESLGLGPGGAAVLSTLTRVATYAPDLGKISADAAIGQLQLVLEGNVVYLDGGWQTLVDGLSREASAAGVRLLAGQRVAAIRSAEQYGWDVTAPEQTVHVTSVVIAAGGPDAARGLLPEAPPWELGSPASAACLDLGLRGLPDTKVAFGLDEPLYLSTHSPNAKLAPVGGSVVHVMRYGARTSAEDQADLWRLATGCGISDKHVAAQRFLHAMTVCHALPQPGSGLAGRPAIDAAAMPGVFLAGDWIGPVGLLADAALSSGEAAGSAAASWAARSGQPAVGGMVTR